MNYQSVDHLPVHLASSLALGLLAGALTLEGAVLVPYWRTLGGGAFGELQSGFGPRLFRFFAPLTGGAVALALATGALSAWGDGAGRRHPFTIAAAVLAASLLAFYGLYFHRANERMPHLASTGDHRGLARELRRWQWVHVVRTIVCIGAFVVSLVGLVR